MLDLNGIALFVEVARAGSFVAAGRRLGIPSNTVSRNIQQLEKQLGNRLMQRSTRKLTLTAAGKAFFERCAGAVEDLSQAGSEVMVGATVIGGLIRVAAPAAFFDLFAIEWVAEFLRSHPQVRLEFALSDARADLIAEGIDVAFRSGPLSANHFSARRLLPAHFSIVASPAYLQARGTPSDIRDLAHHDCITLLTGSSPNIWRLTNTEPVQVSGRFSANTAQAILQAALAGLGIALLPEIVTAAEIAAGRLVQILPAHRRDGGNMYAVFPSRRHVPRAVLAFVEFAAAKLQTDVRRLKLEINPAAANPDAARASTGFPAGASGRPAARPRRPHPSKGPRAARR